MDIGLKANLLSSGVGLVGGMLQGQNQTGVGNFMGSAGSIVSNIPGGQVYGAALQAAGALTNAAFGSNINQAAVDQSRADVLSARGNAGAYNSNASLAANGPQTLSMLSKSDVGTDGWLSGKASKLTKQLNEERRLANLAADNDYERNVLNVDKQTDRAAMANLYAMGGGLQGMNDEMNMVGAGGSHEQNPMGGVPMGTDENGTPNLVEEGEVIWKDYVFSARLKCPEDVKKLVNGEGSTYAEVAESLKTEGNETVGDGISKGTLEDNLTRLKDSQEAQKAEKEAKTMEAQQGNQFAEGGLLVDKLQNQAPLVQYNPLNPYNGFALSPLTDPSATSKLLASESAKSLGSGNATVRLPKENWLSGLGENTDPAMLRYAPAIGSAVDVIKDSLGLQNKPDYTNADAVLNEAARQKPQNVSYDRQGSFVKYSPTDRNFLLSLQSQKDNATAAALASGANGNANLMALQRLALNNQSTQNAAAAEMQTRQADLQARNAATAQNNQLLGQWSQGAMSADAQNAQMKASYDARLLDATAKAAAMREQIDSTAATNKAAHEAALYQNLGTIGKDSWLQNNINDSSIYGYAINPTTGHISFESAKKEKALGGLLKRIKK